MLNFTGSDDRYIGTVDAVKYAVDCDSKPHDGSVGLDAGSQSSLYSERLRESMGLDGRQTDPHMPSRYSGGLHFGFGTPDKGGHQLRDAGFFSPPPPFRPSSRNANYPAVDITTSPPDESPGAKVPSWADGASHSRPTTPVKQRTFVDDSSPWGSPFRPFVHLNSPPPRGVHSAQESPMNGTSRYHGFPSPSAGSAISWASPGKDMRTPVRTINNSLQLPHEGGAMLTPSRRSLSSTPFPSQSVSRRPETLNARRYLDGNGMSQEPHCQPLTYGGPCHLLAVFSSVVFQWTPSGVRSLLEASCDATAVAASAGGESQPQFAAVGLQNGLLHIFEFNSCGEVVSTAVDGQLQGRITCLCFSEYLLYCGTEDGTFVLIDVRRKRTASAADSSVVVARLDDSATMYRANVGSAVCCIDVTDDGNHVALGCQSGQVLVFHRSHMSQPRDITCELQAAGAITAPATKAVQTLSWASSSVGLGTLVYATGSILVIYSLNNGLKLYRETLAPIHAIRCCRRSNEIIVSQGASRSAGSADGRMVALYELNVPSFRLKKETVFSGHNADVMHMCLDPSESLLVTTCLDNSIRFFDLSADGGTAASLIPSSIPTRQFGPLSEMIVAVDRRLQLDSDPVDFR